MSQSIVNEIREKLLEVVRLMNQAAKSGVRVEFSISLNAQGDQVLTFKALQEMKLD